MASELKRARGHVKSGITKRVKEIIHLMRTKEKDHEDTVQQKLAELKETFLNFDAAHKAYHDQLSDEELIEESSEYYEIVRTQLEQLEENVDLWIAGLEATSWVNKLQADVKPDDSISQIGSNLSSRLSFKDRKIRASATKSILKAESVALKKLHQIELEELQIMQRKAQLQLEMELAKANAEDALNGFTEPKNDKAGGDKDRKLNQPPSSTPIKGEDNDGNKKPEEPPLNSKPIKKEDKDENEKPDESVKQLESQHTKQIESLIKQQQQTLCALTLPQPELQVFNGDPAEYHEFTRAFEHLVEQKTQSPSARLYYLVQYTNGQVRELVRSCLAMPEKTGYTRAKSLLAERYGQPYHIATALVDRVTNGPPIQNENADALRSLSIGLTSCSNTLQEIGYLNRLENPENLRKIIDRLPYNLRQRWREKVDSITMKEKRDANLADITEFVTERARVANHPIFGKLSSDSRPPVKPLQNRRNIPKAFAIEVTKTQGSSDHQASPSSNRNAIKCPSCNKDHWLSQCNDFKALKVSERYKLVRTKRLCINCLTPGHYVSECPKKSFCRVSGCEKKHSTFLHDNDKTNAANNTRESSSNHKSEPEPKQPGNSNACINTNTTLRTASNRSPNVVLPIVPVQVKAKGQNKKILTYALLDSGSNSSFCTDAVLNELSAHGEKTELTLTTLNTKERHIKCTVVDLEITDLSGKEAINLSSVYSCPSLPVTTDDIGQQQDINRWPHLNGVHVETIDATIGLLIGNDHPKALQPIEVKSSQNGGPYAVRTVLGWVLNGPLLGKMDSNATVNATKTEESTDLTRQFERYCNLEFNDNSYTSNQSLSQNDCKALQIMKDNVMLKNSHYEIALPWKEYPPPLENNGILAENRLATLKKRLSLDQNLHEKYAEFMEGLVVKNYAEKVKDEEVNSTANCYYLPHHPILPTPAKPKVRVVYDCQAKYKGTSLNEQLLQGPDLTNSLVGVLTRFRKEPIAFISDIESMFYQVRVRPSDCDYLRFLWWPQGNLNANPEEYRMLVHLFGSVSSPSCANYALKKTAQDNEKDYDSSVIDAVNNSFYVDDCLHSTATEREAIKLASDLRELLAKGGFRLTKFVSNSKGVLSSLPESERATSMKTLDFDNPHMTERALGVQWDVNKDTFTYKIVPKDKPTNRRGLLSVISSVYDPLGFVSPCILPAKEILQDLCRKGLGWDDAIPETDQVKWKKWLSDLPQLEHFSIPRTLKPATGLSTVQRYELHHFSDASTKGYGAVSYLRQVDINDQVHCALVMAKSRLAPLKAMTIPRMELSAAVLATRLDQMISKEINLPLAKSTFWTDSTCVIRYLENQDKRFQVFVANRVAAIHERSEPAQWRYVESEQNPADEASRGMSFNELLNNERWTNGPPFLWLPEESWPQRPANMSTAVAHDDPEVKRDSQVCANTTKGDDAINRMIEKFSSWKRLRRVTSWILRYKTKLRQQVQNRRDKQPARYSQDIKKTQPLSLTELNTAEIEILKHIQRQGFKEELSILNSTSKETSSIQPTVKKASSLHRLDPIMKNDLIVVGGRLQRSALDESAKHPVVIPRKHHVAKLIIQHYHQLCGHSGTEHTLSLIRQRFWIIGARASVRNLVRSCVDCRKRQAPVMQQKMANLPADRVTATKPPFTFVGVDCFGPFQVRRGRANVKRYGVLFTCLSLRAVHIEIANSLDTDSFINALRRFIARRGLPEEMRSDNGGNFVSGERELRQAIADWNQLQINDYLSQRGIKWTFNPPAGSHHGGVWERCIRTVRKVLRALVKEQQLDDESLSTLMCEVESIVNGRPITKLSDDPKDAEPLTPNHLLLLRAGSSVPPGVFDKQDIYSRKRWRQVQYLANVFWRRWTREYLPSLQERQKWSKQLSNVSVDDVVLVTDDNSPRSSWPLARIMEVRKSTDDGLVRSVRLKTNTGELTRPIDKIVMLEVAEDNLTEKDDK